METNYQTLRFFEVEDFKNQENLIPQTKLKAPSPNKNAKPAVIFYNGTFCPVHQGHTDAIETAKEYLKTKNVTNSFLFLCAI